VRIAQGKKRISREKELNGKKGKKKFLHSGEQRWREKSLKRGKDVKAVKEKCVHSKGLNAKRKKNPMRTRAPEKRFLPEDTEVTGRLEKGGPGALSPEAFVEVFKEATTSVGCENLGVERSKKGGSTCYEGVKKIQSFLGGGRGGYLSGIRTGGGGEGRMVKKVSV